MFWANLGIDWPGQMLPMGKYEYLIEDEDDVATFQPLDDNENIKELLRWLYQHTVLKTADNQVIYQEELRFVVNDVAVSTINGPKIGKPSSKCWMLGTSLVEPSD